MLRNPTDDRKGARTKALILETALQLFREQGFEKTTMRGIATAAGLSPGNAYHYFMSKDALIQEFYAELQRQRRARAADRLAGSRKLVDRLAAVLHAGVDLMEPYHDFAASFIRTAVDPRSPSSPFSPESAPVRELGLALFAEVVDGSSARPDARMRAVLPELLWLLDLSVTTYWVYDSSPGRARTRELVDGVAPMVARLLSVARLPVLRRLTDDALGLVERLQP